MNWIYSILIIFISISGFSQTLPNSRSVDWTLAGLRDTSTLGFIEIDVQARGVKGNGTFANDSIIEQLLSSITATGAILNFPTGNFLFNKTINVPNNIVIRGQGAQYTTFTMDLGGTGNAFNIQGKSINSSKVSIKNFASKDSSFITVSDLKNFSSGNWIQIAQNDTDLVTSEWAINSVGQIVKIKSISSDTIKLESPLRMSYDTSRLPYIVKIMPAENVGIECLAIHRQDNTAPEQASNVNFSYAVNCWIKGIESENCTFSHIQANRSSNLYISKSYFHHGFDYGGGGRAYGIMLQATSNECLVENNIFEHLRHSMIVQSGANGNVFTYNYSLDPFWDTSPNDAAGDIVLHGNYTYANLFEQNICQNIAIDNSHGPNGPYNTFFRNRANGFGIFFSAANSPSQNLLGNEITNTTFPYNFVNYTIQGTDHFIYGDNNKGTINPPGTNTLIDSSYAYAKRPNFIPIQQWARIGTPNIMNTASIPAYDRYDIGVIFSNSCGNLIMSVDSKIETKENVLIFPNPFNSQLTIESDHDMQSVMIVDLLGKVVYNHQNTGYSTHLSTDGCRNGVYFVLINFTNIKSITKIVVKTSTF